jgi:hypothetical protein
MIIAKILSFAFAMYLTAVFLHNTALLLSPSKNVEIRSTPPILTAKLAALGWIVFYAVNLVWF